MALAQAASWRRRLLTKPGTWVHRVDDHENLHDLGSGGHSGNMLSYFNVLFQQTRFCLLYLFTRDPVRLHIFAIFAACSTLSFCTYMQICVRAPLAASGVRLDFFYLRDLPKCSMLAVRLLPVTTFEPQREMYILRFHPANRDLRTG